MDLSRDLVKGNLSIVILKLLAVNGEMYGYQLSQTMKQMSHNKIDIAFGSLYPSLHKLKANDLIKMREEYIGARKRIYYSITETGLKKTQSWSKQYLDFFKIMEDILLLKPQKWA